MDAINESRLRVWAQQPDAFRDQAILDADGTIVETDAECKRGVDLSYDRRWGYHPLLVSLANTAEPLFLLNRSGNRPSQERAAEYLSVLSRAGLLGKGGVEGVILSCLCGNVRAHQGRLYDAARVLIPGDRSGIDTPPTAR